MKSELAGARLGYCYRPLHGTWMIPALIIIAVVVIGFLAWELFFVKSGQRAIVEQHRAEGHDDPPKSL